MKNPIRRPFKYCYFNASLILVILNVLVYFVTRINYRFISFFGMCPIYVIKAHTYWQFVTYMFIHGNFWHIFFNMLCLFMFGHSLEKAIGSKEFLMIYFICGIFSAFFSFLIYCVTGSFYVCLIGASGAIYALMFIFAVVYPTAVISFWGIIPMRAPIAVLVFSVIEIVSQFIDQGNVAHMAHLFGFLAAWLYLLIRMGVNSIKIWKNSL
ncbi:MAG: rhomboid family intramembrane serine protease [Treponema sp.]|nr:rhomboid family intramembrane serine protease [Treponema sp.]